MHLEATQGDASAKWKFLTMMTRNVIAMDVDAKGLCSPVSLRLFRHQDICIPNSRFVKKRDEAGKVYFVSEPLEDWDYSKHPEVSEAVAPPSSGRGGRFFWISQKLPAEKTFPEGFEYVLMGIIVGSQPAEIQVAEGEKGLGRMGPSYQNQLGWAATAVFRDQEKLKFTCILTVVTSVDGDDIFSISRDRLLAAEKSR